MPVEHTREKSTGGNGVSLDSGRLAGPHVKTLKPLRILCADDNTILGDVLIRLLSLAGHAVEHAADGLDAWNKLSKDIGGFDVLVTDHEMPGLNGLELVELLRQGNFRGRIIVHSAGLAVADAERYRTLKVDRIIAKGTEAEELLDVVEAFEENE